MPDRPGIRKTVRGLSFLPRMDYPDLFDGLPLGVFAVDRNQRITAFNKQAQKLTGVTPQEAVGAPCSKIFQGGDCRHECPFTDLFDNHLPPSRKEMTLQNTRGVPLRVSMKTAALTDSFGQITGGIASFGRSLGPLSRTMPLNGPDTFEGMVGRSPAMKSIFEKLPDIAQSPVSVLITGESGTGKDMVARAIHNLSDRKENPFQVVNCSALSETLLESELFGHEKGAFTDAAYAKPGRFELAAGGTFFLDEIGDMKPSLQVKFLRVLEQKEFERVGSDRTLKMTARIIAATHHNLEHKDSGFRPDLYYRLRTIPLHLPPLRERKEDIPRLVDHFITAFNHQYNKQVRLLDPAVQSIFLDYDWPGNVRELSRVMEHAFVFVKGPIIFLRYLPENPAFTRGRGRKKSGARPISEKERITRALEKTGRKRAAAAQLLGISRSTLWRKMKHFGLQG